jgi:hypothetical protein
MKRARREAERLKRNDAKKGQRCWEDWKFDGE